MKIVKTTARALLLGGLAIGGATMATAGVASAAETPDSYSYGIDASVGGTSSPDNRELSVGPASGQLTWSMPGTREGSVNPSATPGGVRIW
jgi:hypothetical protein